MNTYLTSIRIALGIATGFWAFSAPGTCQTLAPGQPTAAAPRVNPAFALQPAGEAACPPQTPYKWRLPLAGRSNEDVECFYSTSNWIEPLSQVKFLYGFGQDSKSLSADLATIVFPIGIQAALGTSMTASSAGAGTGNNQAKDSPAQAIERLKSGGDFYLQLTYPLLYKNTTNFTGTVLAVPKLGFSFSGFGSEATITEATEYNVNSSLEAYAEYRALHGAGSFYGDIRSGWQYVRPEFAQAVGLGGKNNFLLTQFAAGIEISGFMRIGFQRFSGPAQAFNVNSKEFSKWHLVLQLAPIRKKQQ